MDKGLCAVFPETRVDWQKQNLDKELCSMFPEARVDWQKQSLDKGLCSMFPDWKFSKVWIKDVFHVSKGKKD